MKPSAVASNAIINSSAIRSVGTPQRKPSMTGLVTPATVRLNTAALKDQLKKKDQHILQLLTEGEMKKAEVAKAASQTEEAETKLFLLKQEFDDYTILKNWKTYYWSA